MKQQFFSTSALFIGGSILRDGNLPGTFRNIWNSQNESDIYVEAETFSGATLEQHWSHTNSLELLKKKNWDFVVLQEQSRRPLLEPNLMLDYAVRWVEAIRSKGACPVLMMTWRRREHLNSLQHWKKLAEAHYHVAEKCNLLLAPVGEAWECFRQQIPEMELFEPTSSHANQIGAYLSACVLYVSMTNRCVTASSPTINLPSDIMRMAERIAWNIVADNCS